MQKIAVVYFPQTNLEKINTFRERYDPGFKIIVPHITIVSPISEFSEDEFIEHIESSVKNVSSFSIHLKGLSKTLDGCLFLNVKEGNEEIANLYKKLYSGILKPFIPTEYSFEPHITLGCFDANGDIFSTAYSEAEKLNIDINCKFDSLSIIKGDGLSPAIVIKTIPLQK
jgi:2'-5' RNA ligase